MIHALFAAIVITAIILATLFGIYAVYTWREVELAKINQAHEIMKAVREKQK